MRSPGSGSSASRYPRAIGRYLDGLSPAFWELVAELDASVFVHPGGSVVGQELMAMYRLGGEVAAVRSTRR